MVQQQPVWYITLHPLGTASASHLIDSEYETQANAAAISNTTPPTLHVLVSSCDRLHKDSEYEAHADIAAISNKTPTTLHVLVSSC